MHFMRKMIPILVTVHSMRKIDAIVEISTRNGKPNEISL